MDNIHLDRGGYILCASGYERVKKGVCGCVMCDGVVPFYILFLSVE